MAQGQAREAQVGQAVVGAHTLQAEGGLAGVVAVEAHTDLVGAQALDGFQQAAHVAAGFAIVQGRPPFRRAASRAQVGGELGFEGVVEHGVLHR